MNIYFHSSIDPLLMEEAARKVHAVSICEIADIGCKDILVCESMILSDKETLEKILTSEAVLLVVGEIDPGLAEILFDKGIAFSVTRDRFMRCIENISIPGEVYGEILLIGPDAVSEKIIKSVAKLFGFDCVTASTIDGSLEKVSGKSLVFHDLSCPEIDIFSFVKRMSHSQLRSVPYVAYKSSGSRIELDDIQSGIKTFTRLILTHREAYALCAQILFRSLYYPALSRILSFGGEDLTLFGAESLKRIFFTRPDRFFLEKPVQAINAIEKMAKECDAAQALLAKLECVKWIVAFSEDHADRIG